MTKESRSWGWEGGLPNEKVLDVHHLTYMCKSQILVSFRCLGQNTTVTIFASKDLLGCTERVIEL